MRAVACQAPLSLEFFKLEYWIRFLFPPSVNLPTQELNPHLLCVLPWQADAFTTVPPNQIRVHFFIFLMTFSIRPYFLLLFKKKLSRVPCTARRSNQSILKEISPECLLEGLMLKLKRQYFGHLIWRANSLEKTLMLGRLRTGGKGDDKGLDGWMASPTRWTWVWARSGRWWRTGNPRRRQGYTMEKKTTSLTSGAGKTGQPFVKEWN